MGHKHWKPMYLSPPMPSNLDKFDKKNSIGSWNFSFSNPKTSTNKVNHTVQMMSEFHLPKLLYLIFFLILLSKFTFMFVFLSNQIYERRFNKFCPFILSARCSAAHKQSIIYNCPKHHNFFYKIYIFWLKHAKRKPIC